MIRGSESSAAVILLRIDTNNKRTTNLNLNLRLIPDDFTEAEQVFLSASYFAAFVRQGAAFIRPLLF